MREKTTGLRVGLSGIVALSLCLAGSYGGRNANADVQGAGRIQAAKQEENEPPGTTHAVLFEEDRDVGPRLRKAAQLKAAGKMQQAFDLYLWVLENGADGLFRLDDDRFLSVRDVCIQNICQLPAEFLTQYRLRVDGEVARLFREAREHASPGELESLGIRYFLSSHGPEMLDLAGDMYAEQGAHPRAASCWWQLLKWGTSAGIQREVVETKLALALARSGREREARTILDGIRKRNPDASLVLGGDRKRVVDYLDAELPKEPAAPSPAAGVSAGHWPQFGGGATHGACMPADFQCDVKTGEFPIPGCDWQIVNPSKALQLQIIVNGVNSGRTAATEYFPFHPIYAQGRAFIHDESGLMAFRLSALGEDWVVGEMGAAPAGVAGPRRIRMGLNATVDLRAFACAYENGVVYASFRSAPSGPEVWAVSEKGKILWRLAKNTREFEWLGEMADISDPVVSEGRVYFCVWKVDEWRRDCYLVSVDALDGRLNWRRFLCSGPKMQMYYYGTWRLTPTLALPAASDGVVVVCSNVGGIVAVDGRSGEIRWGFAYDQAAGGNPFSGGPDQRPAGYVASANSTPLIRQGKVYVAPVDSTRIYALDLTSGECLWRTSRGDHDRIVGIAGDHLILSGKKVTALKASSGNLAWEFNKEDMGCSGQGFVTREAVYVPGAAAICKLDPGTGALIGRVLVSSEAEECGNLLLVDDTMLQVGHRVGFYGLWNKVYAEIERDIRLDPKAPEPHIRLAGIYARREASRDAIRSYERALELLTGLGNEATARTRQKVEERLYDLYSAETQKAFAEAKADDALRFAQHSMDYAFTDTQRVESVVRLAGIYENRREWANVVRQLQSFLENPPMIVYSFDGDSSMLPALYARLRIDELIAKRGREIYAAIETKAKQLCEKGLESDLEKVVDVYPNSLSARGALVQLSDRAAASRKYRLAGEYLREYLRLGTNDPDSLAQVKWKLADYYERDERYKPARQILEELARAYPAAMVGTGENKKPLSEVVAAKLKEPAYQRALVAAAQPAFRVPLKCQMKFPAGGASLQVLSGGVIVLADGTGTVRGVDGTIGKLLWSRKPGDTQASACDVKDDRLLLLGGRSVRMIDTGTGRELWSCNLARGGANVAARMPFNVMAQGAATDGSYVAVNVVGAQQGVVVLDANAGGKLLWEKRLAITPMWTPRLWQNRVVVTTATHIVVLDLKTGEKVAEIPHQNPTRPAVVLDDGRALVAGQTQLQCVDLAAGKVLWSRPYQLAYSGYLQMQADGIIPVDGKNLFVSQTMDRRIICVDVESGKELWSEGVGDNTEQAVAVRADGEGVYVIMTKFSAFDRGARVIRLDLKTGQKRWTSQVMKDANGRDWQVGKDFVAVLVDRWKLEKMDNGQVMRQQNLDSAVFCIDKSTGQTVQELTLKSERGAPGVDRPTRLIPVDEILWVAYQDKLVGLVGPR